MKSMQKLGIVILVMALCVGCQKKEGVELPKEASTATPISTTVSVVSPTPIAPTTSSTPIPMVTPKPIPTATPTPSEKTVSNASYGVFLSVMPGDTQEIYNYDTIVIDAQYFSASDIKKLHKNGQQVYSYLNIGAIENFRDYYKKYVDLSLGAYENWEEERWMDVSSKTWQKFMGEKAKELVKKGIDGLFLDNCDVYYLYHKKSIYNGLCSILKQLGTLECDIVINGGDTFVSKYLKEHKGKANVIDAVNQEDVFSSFDFEHNTFSKQGTDTREYYCNYLKQCASYGLEVYLLEYTTDESLIKTIKAFCKKHEYHYYIADSITLN